MAFMDSLSTAMGRGTTQGFRSTLSAQVQRQTEQRRRNLDERHRNSQYADMTMSELRAIGAEQGVTGRWGMNKTQLIDALEGTPQQAMNGAGS